MKFKTRTLAARIIASTASVGVSPPQVVYRQAPAPSGGGTKSAEQRIKELDSLAAKGLISKSEYQTRKKATIDDI